MTFTELGMPDALLAGLAKQRISAPMPIQLAALPLLMEGRNAYLNSETGTGKTLAYLLPIFCRIDPSQVLPQAIVLAPTHELAVQIHRQATNLATNAQLPIRCALLIGGVALARQLDKLKDKPHLVIGSPGRIQELNQMRKLKMHAVKTIVIDEADRLLNGETLRQVNAVIRATLKDRQLIFASATEQAQASQAAANLAPGLVMVRAGINRVNADIEHFYMVCEQRDKPELLRKLVHAMQPERAIVFVHRNTHAETIAAKLAHHHVMVADLHGAVTKQDREKALTDLRSGRVQLLIASDLAARGLDIEGVNHIFNLDPPSSGGNYVHRVGRTGRAGAKGCAITLLSKPEMRLLRRYAAKIGRPLTPILLRDGQIHYQDPLV